MDSIQSKVEKILYKYVGIEKPTKEEKQQNGTLEVDTSLLLPNDLEQVSPDSDKKSTDNVEEKEELEEEIVDEDDDFESPAFEPIEPIKTEKNENSQVSNLSEISGLTSQDSVENKSHKSEPTVVENQQKVDTALSQISSTQDNIPDIYQTQEATGVVITVSGISGEEAQMATGLNDSTENAVVIEPEKTPSEPVCQFDLNKDTIEFTGTERKSINLDDSTNSGESEKLAIQAGVQDAPTNMDVDNLYENDTTDSSEMRMEIDLKDESTQGTANSSKVEESSQDSSKQKGKKDEKNDRSKDRNKSSHTSSRHHHHSSSSSKSKQDEKHKSRSKDHKSSSSYKKSSSDKERSSSGRRDRDRERDRKSESSSKSRQKHEDQKLSDDHHQEKTTRRRRSTDHDSKDGLNGKPNNGVSENPNVIIADKGKSASEQSTSNNNQQQQQDQKTSENKAVLLDTILKENCELSIDSGSATTSSKTSKEQKSSILVKYDYLKSPCKLPMTSPKTDEDTFRGFKADTLPDNPWFECMRLIQSEKFPFTSNNSFIEKKQVATLNASKKAKPKAKIIDSTGMMFDI